MNRIIRKYWCFMALAILFSACADKIEGCLDIDATNFDVTADNACLDCCTYPDLSLSFSFVWDTLPFNNSSFYSSVDQPLIQLVQAQVLISQIELIAGEESIQIEDTISLPLLVNGEELEQSFVDDFNRVSREINFSYTIGELSSLQTTIDSLHFQIGLVSTLSDIDTSAMPAGHPLTNAITSLYDAPGTGYQSIRFQVVTDSAAANPDTLTYLTGLLATRPVKLSVNQQVNRGFDLGLALEIDYQKWFEGINFAVDPETLIEEKLLENASSAFSTVD